MKTRGHMRTGSGPGFTLIEVLVVVVILGIMAMVVVAQFASVTTDAAQTAFIQTGRILAEAATRYKLDYGEFPNAAPDTLPYGFGDYVTSQQFEGGTSIGGVWDTAVNAYGVQASIVLFFNDPDVRKQKPEEYMAEIDLACDDGDLSTGFFRKASETRYIFVVAF